MKILLLPVYYSFSFLLITGTFLPNSASGGNIYKQLNVVKCDSLVKANQTNPNFVILDVRTPGEWNSAHLLGSINHSTGNTTFDAELAALPKHKIYLLHCQSGTRRAPAFAKMKNLGFAEVYEMIGGIGAWKSAGFTTTTYAGPKLMLVSVLKISSKSAAYDTTRVTVTNRANGSLSFTGIKIKDDHSVNHNFDLARTLNGAGDYSFLIFHPAGFGDSTKIAVESNGGNIGFAIGNPLFVYAETNRIPEIKIYPNPVSDFLNISTTHSLIDEISIFNLSGRLVYRVLTQKNSEVIDLSEFKEGFYLSRIKVEGQIITHKIIVSR